MIRLLILYRQKFKPEIFDLYYFVIHNNKKNLKEQLTNKRGCERSLDKKEKSSYVMERL